jgi:uncharacterized membrane protein
MREIGTIPRIISFFGAGIVLLFIGWAAPLPPPAGIAAKENALKDNMEENKEENL